MSTGDTVFFLFAFVVLVIVCVALSRDDWRPRG
jgi:hypothetical protein